MRSELRTTRCVFAITGLLLVLEAFPRVQLRASLDLVNRFPCQWQPALFFTIVFSWFARLLPTLT